MLVSCKMDLIRDDRKRSLGTEEQRGNNARRQTRRPRLYTGRTKPKHIPHIWSLGRRLPRCADGSEFQVRGASNASQLSVSTPFKHIHSGHCVLRDSRTDRASLKHEVAEGSPMWATKVQDVVGGCCAQHEMWSASTLSSPASFPHPDQFTPSPQNHAQFPVLL